MSFDLFATNITDTPDSEGYLPVRDLDIMFGDDFSDKFNVAIGDEDRGKIVIVEDEYKLGQGVNKILGTPKGDDTAFPEYGSEIATFVGKKAIQNETYISLSVSNALSYYKNNQINLIEEPEDRELLKSIDSVQIDVDIATINVAVQVSSAGNSPVLGKISVSA